MKFKINSKQIQLSINAKSLFLWYLPLFFCLLFEFFFSDFRGYNIRNLAENLVFATSLCLLIVLIKNLKYKLLFAKLVYTFFVLSLSIETLFYYFFSTYFTESTIFIFLETNPSEVSEFLNMYVDYLSIAFLCTQLLFIFIFNATKYHPIVKTESRFSKIYPITLNVLLLTLALLLSLPIANFPYQFITGVAAYFKEINRYEDLKIDTRLGNFHNVKFSGKDEPHTFVMIIGESTTRKQLGIYNYYRETTPLLSKRKTELLIYQDVISSESHTIESLQAALSLHNFKDKTESTLIQLMNQANFKTFWLSNQNPIGIYATLLTKMSKAADVYTYTNLGSWKSFTPFDEKLLPHLDEALNDTNQNKFIVIHLMATHGQYKLRYPTNFNVFKDIPITNFSSDENHKIINEYHNAIRYVDTIVNTIIEKVAATQTNSYVVYFSDHGEEMLVDRDFFGHNSTDTPTKSMYEIPFFVWLSDSYKSNYEILYQPKQPYMIDDLLHSMSDLSKVQFKEFKPEASIFSKDFKPKPRILGNSINFDTYFKD